MRGQEGDASRRSAAPRSPTKPASTSTQTADSLNVNVGQDAGNVNIAGSGKAERTRGVLLKPPAPVTTSAGARSRATRSLYKTFTASLVIKWPATPLSLQEKHGEAVPEKI